MEIMPGLVLCDTCTAPDWRAVVVYYTYPNGLDACTDCMQRYMTPEEREANEGESFFRIPVHLHVDDSAPLPPKKRRKLLRAFHTPLPKGPPPVEIMRELRGESDDDSHEHTLGDIEAPKEPCRFKVRQKRPLQQQPRQQPPRQQQQREARRASPVVKKVAKSKRNSAGVELGGIILSGAW